MVNINRFCINLSIGFDIVCPDIDRLRSKSNAKIVSMYPANKELLDTRLVSFLDKHNMYVFHNEIFFTPARFTSPIHIDHTSTDNHTKLNFVFDAVDSHMVWYTPKDKFKPFNVQTTVINTKYCVFKYDDVFELHRAKVRMPSLVNAGIPHNIVNNTDKDRWCLSCVIRYKDRDKNIQIDEATKVFSDYIY